MLKISLIAFTLFLSFTLFGQGWISYVVYLKDGTVVRGSMFLQDPGNLIQINSYGKKTQVIKYDQIDSIARVVRPRYDRKTGYFNLTETGVMSGSFSPILSITNINSWKFSNGFSAGLGLGLELSNEKNLPVMADFRYSFRQKRPLPFVSVQTGYSFLIAGSYENIINEVNHRKRHYIGFPDPVPLAAKVPVSASGGFFISPAIGIQTPINENFALTFSIGYNWMHLDLIQADDYTLNVDFNRVALKFGLLFK